jgi:hypothetical protein
MLLSDKLIAKILNVKSIKFKNRKSTYYGKLDLLDIYCNKIPVTFFRKCLGSFMVIERDMFSIKPISSENVRFKNNENGGMEELTLDLFTAKKNSLIFQNILFIPGKILKIGDFF